MCGKWWVFDDFGPAPGDFLNNNSMPESIRLFLRATGSSPGTTKVWPW